MMWIGWRRQQSFELKEGKATRIVYSASVDRCVDLMVWRKGDRRWVAEVYSWGTSAMWKRELLAEQEFSCAQEARDWAEVVGKLER